MLAWNRLGHALIAGHYDFAAPGRPEQRPNLTRMLFLDPHTRDLYRRLGRGGRPGGRLAAPGRRAVTATTGSSPTLDRRAHPQQPTSSPPCGAEHPVHNCVSGIKHLRHPEVGELDVEFQILHLPDDSGQRIMTYTASPASPSEAALRLLNTSLDAPRPVAGAR